MLPPLNGKHFFGFLPETNKADLDFISVHIYPQSGKVGDAIRDLKMYAVGKPVVIEETFTLSCGGEDLRKFFRQSKGIACGWIGHYLGESPAQLEALMKAKKANIGQALTLEYYKIFEDMRSEMIGEPK